jgi:hypothetical protein
MPTNGLPIECLSPLSSAGLLHLAAISLGSIRSGSVGTALVTTTFVSHATFCAIHRKQSVSSLQLGQTAREIPKRRQRRWRIELRDEPGPWITSNPIQFVGGSAQTETIGCGDTLFQRHHAASR